MSDGADTIRTGQGRMVVSVVATTPLAIKTPSDSLMEFFSAEKYAEALQGIDWDFSKELALYHSILQDKMTPAKDRMRAAEKIREVGKDILRMTGKIVEVVAQAEQTVVGSGASEDVLKTIRATTQLLQQNLNSKQTVVAPRRFDPAEDIEGEASCSPQ